jgi:hypothetical protein
MARAAGGRPTGEDRLGRGALHLPDGTQAETLMQAIQEIILLDDAVRDLDQGRRFYDGTQAGIGDCFYDALLADIESLYLYAGIHQCRFDSY